MNHFIISKNIKPAIWLLSIVLLMVSSSCQGIDIKIPEFIQTSTPDLTRIQSSQTATQPTPTLTAGTPTPVPPQTITIWVPPALDPYNEETSGNILKNQLLSFAEQQNNLQINVRVKAESGPAGLLNSLIHTQTAAPVALPSLIILNRSDLEKAVENGLIYPMDRFSEIMEGEEWFAYSRDLVTINDLTYGLPLGGETEFLLYRAGVIESPEENWESIFAYGHPILFPAASEQAWLTLHLYLSAGGQVINEEGKPYLDEVILQQVLNLYMSGAQHNSFPYWLTQYETDEQTWAAYEEQQSHWLISPSTDYLSKLPADTIAVPLPPLTADTAAYSMVDGLVLAVATPDLSKQELAVQLAEYLTNPTFLARWSFTAGFVPTNNSVLESWPNQGQRSLLESISLSANILPDYQVLETLYPILSDVTFQVIKLQMTPEEATLEAIQKLTTNQSP